MPVMLIIEYPTQGPFGADAADADRVLASDIAGEQGLEWKLWLEDAPNGQAAGLYLFTTREIAQNYTRLHLARLASFGIANVSTKIYEVNEPLSSITRGLPL